MDHHELYMRRCISLASAGLGNTAPNPLVGAVVVKDNKIIGEGFHAQFGGPHAEVNAINEVPDKELLKGATLYVNLEPCNHHGKTPPCTELIIDHKLAEVVIGCPDPNPLVMGNGIRRLINAGIKVTADVLLNESRFLNRRFIKMHEKKEPYIILKWARSRDGFMDKMRAQGERGVNWISGTATKRLVHKWRSEEQAILVGENTVRNDDPELTVREVAGQNPVRILLSPQLQFPQDARILNGASNTLVFYQQGTENQALMRTAVQNNSFIAVQHDNMINEMLRELALRSIQSVMVEGGAYTINELIATGKWDEARIVEGPVEFLNGLKAPVINMYPHEEFMSGNDNVKIYFNS